MFAWVRATWVRRRHAPMAITPIIHMHARLMATTGRNGSQAVSLSAQGRGITAITVRAIGLVGVTGLATDTMDAEGAAITVAATTGPVPTDTIEAAELVMAGATHMPRWAAVASTVVAGAVKRSSELAEQTAGSECCQPFFFSRKS